LLAHLQKKGGKNMAKKVAIRWFVQPLNEKAKSAAKDFNEQCPENYNGLVEALYPDGLREVRGVWEIMSYAFLEIMHRDPEMRFLAFSQKGKAHKRPWTFPFDNKKKLERRVRRAITKIKPVTGTVKL
jgi:hypothetical protein